MDHKPIIPIEAALPPEAGYQGPLVLPKPGAFAAARAGAQAEAAPAAEAAAQEPRAATNRNRNRFAGARPISEWPQAWML